MSKLDPSSWPADLRAIHESKGMQFLNDQRKRSFSLNILYMNGVELLTASAKIHDPDIGFSLMGMNNREASEQAHREVKRHLHNFVASAMTLVDHTRVMLNERYKDLAVHKTIIEKIKSTVGSSPVCKFIQDMRNYIVHKGLPNSQIYMHANNNGNDTFYFKTGIHIETASLHNYSNWTALSKEYLNKAPEYIEINELVEQYIEEIKNFNLWLDAALEEHHSDDLQEFYQLQAEQNAKYPLSDFQEFKTESKAEKTSIEPTLEAEINKLAESARSKITEYQSPKVTNSDFHSQRVALTIEDQEIMRDAIHFINDQKDGDIIIFIQDNNKSYGIAVNDTLALQELFEKISEQNWVKNKFDYQFVFDSFIKWSRKYWQQSSEEQFYCYLLEQCKKEISLQTVFYPIAQLEIAQAFSLGSVTIAPLSAEFFDQIEKSLAPTNPVDKENFKMRLQEWRRKYQGTAAVQIKAETHPSFVDKSFYTLATHCIDILRFFSPWAKNASLRTSVALKGADYLPIKNIFAFSSDRLMISEGLREEYITQWQMTESDINSLLEQGLDKAGQLIDENDLTAFEKNVRTAIILFSKGCSITGEVDRLHYTLSAAEEIYLRHDIEHAESLIAKRVSSLIERNTPFEHPLRPQIVKAYFMRNDYKLRLSPAEQEAIQNCTFAIYQAILIAMENMHIFSTKEEFIFALESEH